MKKISPFIFCIFLLTAPPKANAQFDFIKKADTLIQNKFLLNFMVPDIPSFLALDETPSNLLKPSAPRDLSVMFSSFRSGGEFVIPTSFAAEFAPGLFASTKINLQAYQKNYWIRMLTKTRLSLATKYDDGNSFSRMAGGIKLTLIDEGDYRSDTAFLQENIYAQLDEFVLSRAKRKQAYMKENKLTAIEFAEMSESWNQQEDSMTLLTLKNNFDHSIEAYKRSHWNATRMDFAYTAVAASNDTLLKNAKVNKHLLWLVYALKPGKNCDWAQVIFGVNNQWAKLPGQSMFTNNFSANTRAYFGTNKAKGYAELQFKNTQIRAISNDQINALLVNFGLDIDVYSGFWLHLGGGVNNILGKNGRTELLGNMNIYISLPENFKLF